MMNNNKMNAAFTLVELLVYIVIATIVGGLAMWVWYDATVFNSKTRTKMMASEESNQLLMLIAEDFPRLGSKNYMLSLTDSTLNNSRVYWDLASGDSSSFYYLDSGSFDKVAFKASSFNSSGEWTGTDSVIYYVNSSKQLVRKAVNFNTSGTLTDSTSVVVIPNVSQFNVYAGQTLDTGAINSGNETIKYFGLRDSVGFSNTSASDIVVNSDSSVTWKNLQDSASKIKFAFLPAKCISVNDTSVYEVEFKFIANEAMVNDFDSKKDSIRFNLQGDNSQGSIMQWNALYPGKANDNTTRVFEFSPRSTRPICNINFDIYISNPNPSSWTIQFGPKFTIRKISTGRFTWDSVNVLTTSTNFKKYKKQVKAFRFDLGVRKTMGKDTIILSTKRIIQTPSNGTSIVP